MYNPVSTIRLQFNKNFTFRQLDELVPFFIDLGVKTIYASPIFKSTPGSLHGYDVADPLTINPEIGTKEELVELSKKFKDAGIGWIQDIVPNHMAFDPSNPWLADLLEKGPTSAFAEFFDTPFTGDFFSEKMMVPFDYKVNEEFFRICNYKETDSRINYRRFFTINGLLCTNMQNRKVFDKYHELIGELVHNGTFQGLRVDHIDGLYDPDDYLRKLRDLAGPDVYIVIEKILEPDEPLNKNWPIQGTTGYEFLATVNNLFTWSGSQRTFNDLYSSISPSVKPFGQRVYDNKELILSRYMGGELDNLTRYFHELNLGSDDQRVDMKEAIAAFMIRCPYYRFYGNIPLDKDSETAIEELIDECRVNLPRLADAFDELDYALVEHPRIGDKKYNQRADKFYKRLMQFTGPLMAKGVEDTLMYNFNRFIAHNEVGDSPEEFGVSVSDFHDAMIDRYHNWPLCLNATATHDTKRGEDARMRLNVLTDLPKEWSEKVNTWFRNNKVLQPAGKIDKNDEYFIYQTLVATYPHAPESDYVSRVEEYMTKVLREAKVHSRWDDPDEAYENAVIQFIRNLLNDQNDFLHDFRPFARKVSDHGIVNSLAQLVLKFTCPGVPDTYQSSMHLDLSMVDPDNRRPVDFEALKDAARNDHTIKLWLTKKLMHIRAGHKNIFTCGRYVPLKVTGLRSRHVIAFAREHQGNWIVVAAMLHSAQLQNGTTSINWSNTAIQLPDDCPLTADDLIEGGKRSSEEKLEVRELFSSLPVAVLHLKAPVSKRSAGILMPVASLPSNYSIGDIGSSARRFADLLFESGQKIWQMLPVNEADRSAAFSPYSAISSMAGSSILIDTDDLVEDGLLQPGDVRKHKPTGSKVGYEKALREKHNLLEKAWLNFADRKPAGLTKLFVEFVEQEKQWLDGYARFKVLRRINDDKPWPQWPKEFRSYDGAAWDKIENENRDEILKTKWIQFIFFRQMKSLRKYCNDRGIRLMGDVPFYVHEHSADVWIYRDVFDIDDEGRPGGMAGVPPDYFNDEGQLWGMPVFNWEKNKELVYRWWTERLRKNLEMYDLVRLDHFRAFVDYWSVKAGSKNAVTGEWLRGPGLEFFKYLKDQLGELSFIAEDLGDVGHDVYDLCGTLSLPGMKVLQFGFGSDFPASVHLPHNYSALYVAYPGTHDNNTTRGWFNRDATPLEKKNLSAYFNMRVTSKNVSDLFMRVVYASHADIAMVAMQDVLDLDEKARINTPSTSTGNWTWRMKEGPVKGVVQRLRRMVFMYER